MTTALTPLRTRVVAKIIRVNDNMKHYQDQMEKQLISLHDAIRQRAGRAPTREMIELSMRIDELMQILPSLYVNGKDAQDLQALAQRIADESTNERQFVQLARRTLTLIQDLRKTRLNYLTQIDGFKRKIDRLRAA
jgi:uncharacterized protein YicC (UPF0701 family)